MKKQIKNWAKGWALEIILVLCGGGTIYILNKLPENFYIILLYFIIFIVLWGFLVDYAVKLIYRLK